MALLNTEAKKQVENEVLDKPDSCDIAIVHNSTPLDLNKAGSVVQVNSDRGGGAKRGVQREPVDLVLLNLLIVSAVVNVAACNKDII